MIRTYTGEYKGYIIAIEHLGHNIGSGTPVWEYEAESENGRHGLSGLIEMSRIYDVLVWCKQRIDTQESEEQL